MNEISFSYERMGTKTRFEKEAKRNSEMAYCYTRSFTGLFSFKLTTFSCFRGTFVENYTIFWVGIQSVTVHGPPSDPQTPPMIQPSFPVRIVIVQIVYPHVLLNLFARLPFL